MGMMMQVLAPGMQDAEEADLGAQVFWIARDGEQRFSAGTKEDVVDDRLVPIGKRGQRCRQGEDDVEVLDGQQLRLALLEPLGALFPLTLGAVAIAAGVVADAQVFTLAAFLDMAAAVRGPAGLDGPHQLVLMHGERASLPVSGSLLSKDVSQLQGWPRHLQPAVDCGLVFCLAAGLGLASSFSSGLTVAATSCVDTRV